jgi:DeoR family fructose operon transcriptional repressor
MNAMERYRSIVERVRGKGRASVNDLADHLDVAPETIRRDLSYLEKQGLVQRVHGGAIPVWLEPTVDLRNGQLWLQV